MCMLFCLVSIDVSDKSTIHLQTTLYTTFLKFHFV